MKEIKVGVNMRRGTALVVGFLTLLPFIFWIAIAIFYMTLGFFNAAGPNAEKVSQIFFVVLIIQLITGLYYLLLLIFYLIFLFSTDRVSGDQRVLWAVVLVLGGILAMPFFWYLYIWKKQPDKKRVEPVKLQENSRIEAVSGNNSKNNESNVDSNNNVRIETKNAENQYPGGTFVPYKNPASLIAYYTALFSFIPVIGFVLGILGVSFGIAGIMKSGKNPSVRGKIHSWFGVLFGGFFTIIWSFLIFVIVIRLI